jgi:hypothetical protein
VIKQLKLQIIFPLHVLLQRRYGMAFQPVMLPWPISVGDRPPSRAGGRKFQDSKKSKTRKYHCSIAVYALWHIWKERNMRIF